MKMFVLFCSVCIVYNQSINQSIIKFGKVIGIEQPKKKKKNENNRKQRFNSKYETRSSFFFLLIEINEEVSN